MPHGRPLLLLWLEEWSTYRDAILASPAASAVDVVGVPAGDCPSADHLSRAKVLVAWERGLPPGVLDLLPRLEWIQALESGVNAWLARPDFPPQAALTNGRGAHAFQMPDNILGAIFHVTKPFATYAANQSERVWDQSPPDTVAGKTLGIVGLGAVGSELATRAAGIRMRVIAVRRTPEGQPPPGVHYVYPPEELDTLLEASDYVVLLVPATAATDGLIDATRLAQMKPTAWLLNFARGEVLVDGDLLAAVRTGTIRGAVLDAFRTEPLPAEHPFWNEPRILVSPHVGGRHPARAEAFAKLLNDNLSRYLDGQPLQALIERTRGY